MTPKLREFQGITAGVGVGLVRSVSYITIVVAMKFEPDWPTLIGREKSVLALSGLIHLYPPLSGLIDQGEVKAIGEEKSRWLKATMGLTAGFQPAWLPALMRFLPSLYIGRQRVSLARQTRKKFKKF